jgi:hypothetical protein
MHTTPIPAPISHVARHGRHRHLHPARLGFAGVCLALAGALAACSSGTATTGPGGSVALPSVELPSNAASAVASAGTQAALSALDQVDSAIAANQTAAGLSADDVTALKTLTASIRTALQTGDTTSARSAIDEGRRDVVDPDLRRGQATDGRRRRAQGGPRGQLIRAETPGRWAGRLARHP